VERTEETDAVSWSALNADADRQLSIGKPPRLAVVQSRTFPELLWRSPTTPCAYDALSWVPEDHSPHFLKLFGLAQAQNVMFILPHCVVRNAQPAATSPTAYC
jgi:hypothetical protein